MITFIDVYDSQTNVMLRTFDVESHEDYHELDDYLVSLSEQDINFYTITRFLMED